MTDSLNDNDRYNRLLLESIGKLSGQTEELNQRYAALDKTICLLKQAYEASLQADRQVMADLLAQVRRITVIVEDLSCQEHTRRLHDFQHRIAALEAYVTPSKWAARFIADYKEKFFTPYQAAIIASVGYGIYLVVARIVNP